MTLSSRLTLQNVIQTQKCKPCQLNKLSTPFPAGGFPPDTASSTRSEVQQICPGQVHARGKHCLHGKMDLRMTG